MLEKMSTSKTEILNAAAEQFMILGADVASVDDIARHLGSTKGRVYHHFASRGSLLSAVRMQAVQFTFRAVLPVIDKTIAPKENFHTMAVCHVLAVLNSLPFHKVILQHYHTVSAKSTTAYERGLLEEIGAERHRYEDLFRDVIERGIACGEFKKQNLSIAMHSVLTLLNAPIFWFTPRPNDDDNLRGKIANQLADMALAALR